MIFRSLVYKKTTNLNKETLETQKAYFFSNIHSEGILKEAELHFADMEENISKSEANLARSCDVADIILLAVIAQIIFYSNGLILGTIITRAIIIFALVYSFFKVNALPKVFYLIPISLLMISIITDIF